MGVIGANGQGGDDRGAKDAFLTFSRNTFLRINNNRKCENRKCESKNN